MTNKENNDLMNAQQLISVGNSNEAEVLLKSIINETALSLPASDVYEKAIELQNKLSQNRKLKKNRIILTSILLILGAIVAIMSESKLHSTNVSAELHVKKLSFISASNIVVENILKFSSVNLNVSSLQTDGLIKKHSMNEEDLKHKKSDIPIKIESYRGQLSAKITGDNLYLDNIDFIKLSRINLSVSEPDLFTIGMVEGGFDAEVQTGEYYNLDCTYCSFDIFKGRQFNLVVKSSDSIKLKSQTNSHMIFHDYKAVNSFLSNSSVSEIHFLNQENFVSESTIISGVVKFNDLQVENLILKNGDDLKLSLDDGFKIEMLNVGRDISIRLSGSVLKLSKNGKDLMPSYLNYFYQSKAIILYMGLLSVLVSLVWLLIQRFELLN